MLIKTILFGNEDIGKFIRINKQKHYHINDGS